jgi:hypothetical protein
MQYYSIFNYLSVPVQQQVNIAIPKRNEGLSNTPCVVVTQKYDLPKNRYSLRIGGIFLFSILIMLLTGLLAQTQSNKKIIEFGWDYPTVDYLRQHLPIMEQRPFDGVVFSFQTEIMEVFRSAPLPDNYFQLEELARLPFHKFTHNFFFIRLQSSDGAHWYDDARWEVIEANAEKLSLAVKTGKVKGCLLDPEYYGEDPMNNPWTYSPRQYPGHSFEQVQEKVRKRGSQFMRALQRHQRSQELLCLWIAGLVLADRQSMPLEKTRQALLPSFFEGMWLAKDSGIHIIDGNELSYWYRTPADFLERTAELVQQSKALMYPKGKEKDSINLEIAQSVFYDGLFATHPSFNKNLSATEKSNWHRQNLRFALATSDRYLWYYTERMNCWESHALTMEAMQQLQALYLEVHKDPKTPVVNATGHVYLSDSPILQQNVAYSATLDLRSGLVSLVFPQRITAQIRIYINHSLAHTTKVARQQSVSMQLAWPKQGSIISEVEFASGEKAYCILKW